MRLKKIKIEFDHKFFCMDCNIYFLEHFMRTKKNNFIDKAIHCPICNMSNNVVGEKHPWYGILWEPGHKGDYTKIKNNITN